MGVNAKGRQLTLESKLLQPLLVRWPMAARPILSNELLHAFGLAYASPADKNQIQRMTDCL